MTKPHSIRKRLLVLGAGGHGRVVAEMALACGYKDIAFVDQQWPKRQVNLDWPVIACDLTGRLVDDDVFVAIGDNKIRLKLIRDLISKGNVLPVLVHPSAVVSQRSVLSSGVVVMPQAVVNVGCAIGLGAIINTAATVDHDCTIGDGVHISPGGHLAGHVSVANCSWIGVGALVREGCHVGENSMIAAGAVVVSNVASETTVYGIPARTKT
jgi:sugar O-acyltransferase (sialic acid O-acetyltransferase NeuD family)